MKNQFYDLQPNLILSTAEKHGFLPKIEFSKLSLKTKVQLSPNTTALVAGAKKQS